MPWPACLQRVAEPTLQAYEGGLRRAGSSQGCSNARLECYNALLQLPVVTTSTPFRLLFSPYVRRSTSAMIRGMAKAVPPSAAHTDLCRGDSGLVYDHHIGAHKPMPGIRS
jgi:hypothetical protein